MSGTTSVVKEYVGDSVSGRTKSAGLDPFVKLGFMQQS